MPGGLPSNLPVCPGGLTLCPAWDGELAWEELFSSLVVVDLEEELVASGGSCTATGGELLPSPGGR